MQLSSLTLILNHPNALLITNKQLKLSTPLQTFNTHTPAKKLSEGQIKWDDTLRIPIIESVNFEIVTKHQFGYNPEQLEAVIQGKINFGREPPRQMKLITSNVYNLHGQKVGHLKVDCTATAQRHHSPKNKSIVISTMREESSEVQNIRVTSIIANVEALKGKSAIVSLKSGRETQNTGQFKSKAGELIFLDDFIFPRQHGQTHIEVTLSVKTEGGSLQSLGQASVRITHDGSLQKKILLKQNGTHIGDMFIEGKIVQFSSSKDALSLLLSRNFESSALMRSSRARSSLQSNGKNFSVVCSNNQIKIPKQRRFFEMAGQRKSSVVSYQQPPSILFPQKRGKFYRGASIGRGYKTDFTRHNGQDVNPGPGQYRLPTMWDRY